MSLNNQQNKLAELEKTVNSNKQTVNQIVSLIQAQLQAPTQRQGGSQ